jgi:hypothetical protein
MFSAKMKFCNIDPWRQNVVLVRFDPRVVVVEEGLDVVGVGDAGIRANVGVHGCEVVSRSKELFEGLARRPLVGALAEVSAFHYFLESRNGAANVGQQLRSEKPGGPDELGKIAQKCSPTHFLTN